MMVSGNSWRVSSRSIFFQVPKKRISISIFVDPCLHHVGIARWAVTDAPSSPQDAVSEKQNHSYFGGSLRSRSASLSPWGSGPEPADHEFMHCLFRRWDVNMN